MTQDTFLGKYMLMYFGFCHCPDICPEELDRMGQVMQHLEQQGTTQNKVTPIFATVDPRRDGPEQMKQYLAGT